MTPSHSIDGAVPRASGTPPALLAAANFYGTLAAVRCLGRAGVPVTMAESRVLAPARWSRYVTRRIGCPDIRDCERFIEWLLKFGEKEPGHVLYPTCDDLAWLYSVHKKELSRHFRLFQPSTESVYSLLNKKHLQLAGSEVGLQFPKTWFPEETPLEQIAKEAKFPVLLKPRTQILFETRTKGRKVDRPEELAESQAHFKANNHYQKYLLDRDPLANQPLIQEYRPEAANKIYNLSGFVDETGALLTVRGSVKVLQRPRQLGIGLCFEEAEVKQELAEKLRALCQKVGYHGVFEVEFIQTEDDDLLIDFNPRFYNQMAFDIARALPLPLLVYEAALGNLDNVRSAIAGARDWKPQAKHIFCHVRLLNLILGAQTLSGRLPASEFKAWRKWYVAHRGGQVDAVVDSGDPLPGMVDLAEMVLSNLRHPRAFVRWVMLDPSEG